MELLESALVGDDTESMVSFGGPGVLVPTRPRQDITIRPVLSALVYVPDTLPSLLGDGRGARLLGHPHHLSLRGLELGLPKRRWTHTNGHLYSHRSIPRHH